MLLRLCLVVLVLGILKLVNGDFLIDQRFRDRNRIEPPPDQFYKTFYDKSYYLQGLQRPVYQVYIKHYF